MSGYKIIMTIGACIIGAYILFLGWLQNIGETKAILLLAYLYYWEGINTETLMNVISDAPWVGGGMVVFGWLAEKGSR